MVDFTVRLLTLIISVLSQNLLEENPGYGIDWMYFPDENETPTFAYLQASQYFAILPDQAEIGKGVIFYLYNRNESKIVLSPVGSYKSIDFRKDIKIVTHGYLSSSSSNTLQSIKDAYLMHKDVNVILVDWSRYAADIFYFMAATRTEQVGKHLAKLVDNLVINGAEPGKIHLIGHSLGAHVSGYAGRGVTTGRNNC